MKSTKEHLDQILFALLGKDDLVKKWWKSPNKAFDLKTPEEVFNVDQKAVITYLINFTTEEYL